MMILSVVADALALLGAALQLCIRQIHSEPRASALARTFGPHDAAVTFHDIADDSESDAEAPMHARGETTTLAKPLEKVRQKLGGDSDASVADADPRDRRSI